MLWQADDNDDDVYECADDMEEFLTIFIVIAGRKGCEHSHDERTNEKSQKTFFLLEFMKKR